MMFGNGVCMCKFGTYDSDPSTAYDGLTCSALGEGCKLGDGTTCTTCWDATLSVVHITNSKEEHNARK